MMYEHTRPVLTIAEAEVKLLEAQGRRDAAQKVLGNLPIWSPQWRRGRVQAKG
jgi:hypothetical protein